MGIKAVVFDINGVLFEKGDGSGSNKGQGGVSQDALEQNCLIDFSRLEINQISLNLLSFDC